MVVTHTAIDGLDPHHFRLGLEKKQIETTALVSENTTPVRK
jgi:hypothetical protein